MNTSVVIVDDEPLALSRMRRLLMQIEGVFVAGEASDGIVALSVIREVSPDIVFLDIDMPKLNGLEVAKTLMSNFENPPAIVFCTAYNEFAIKAFDFAVVAYLLKPVTVDQIKSSIESASRISNVQLKRLKIDLTDAPVDEYISLNGNFGVDRTPISQVYYFRSEQKQIVAGTKSGVECFVNSTLSELQKEFKDSFIRIHRNALLNKQHLSRLTKNGNRGYLVELVDCQYQFVVSRRHLVEVKKLF